MPLEYAHAEKATNMVLDRAGAVSEADVVRKDVRAPMIEFQFDLQKDVQANNPD